jgi:hypothetical protein
MLTSLNFQTLFFEKLIFPTMSKTTKFGKKPQGILGVNEFIGEFMATSNYILLSRSFLIPKGPYVPRVTKPGLVSVA